MSDFEIFKEMFKYNILEIKNYRIELDGGLARPGKILTVLSDDDNYYIGYIFDENNKLKGTKIYTSYFPKGNENEN